MFTLGVIPARSGSKRLPGKNIKLLAGKPLIAWTIEEALASKLDRVIVSTDSEKIAAVARKHEAEVPFLRPTELATDTAKSVDVMIHAAQWCECAAQRPDYVFLLQPTSPTRKASDINAALELLRRQGGQGYVHFGPDGKPSGLLYATSWDLLMKDHAVWNLFSHSEKASKPVLDIDTEDDWKEAERILCK